MGGSSRFSDRIGVTEARTNLQLRDMDDALRFSLWNFVVLRCLRILLPVNGVMGCTAVVQLLAVRYFKVPVDRVPTNNYDSALQWLVEKYHHMMWHQVYNMIEFLVRELGSVTWFPLKSEALAFEVNMILAEELSAYRFIEGILVPISSTAEVQSIENVVTAAEPAGLQGVQTHIETAMRKLALKPHPDYRNSVKEAISAVESAARVISGKGGGLKDALVELEKHFPLRPAMKAGFLSLYGYTSDDDGIRHAILEAPTVGFDEAKFMLVSCSAFAHYLISKADAAGLLRK